MLFYHITSFLAGFLLDLILGDPYFLPHPVRLIGKVVDKLERVLLKKEQTERQKLRRGIFMVFVVLTLTGLAATVILVLAYGLHPLAGILVESLMTYQILATKCLRQESAKVCHELKQNNIDGARYAVSMIVGRDASVLDGAGITKAAVETVAENCSDGVIAPMLYSAFGGPVLGLLYKAVNTMDSMVGYKNETYRSFGCGAAKIDDVMNYLPSRISAILMIAVSFLSGEEYNGKEAFRIFLRDRLNHASPNSAQTESACAGSLGIQLSGDAVYFGRMLKKPLIGDAKREVEYEDIVRAGKLLYRTAILCESICLILLFICWRGGMFP